MTDLNDKLPVNPKKGDVPLPEAGGGAFLRFDIDALERLEGMYGEDYLDVVLKGMSKARVKIYHSMVAVSLHQADGTRGGNGDIPYGLSFEQLQERILNGLYMTIHGRTYDEQKAVEAELMEERVEKLASDPRMASFLSSMPSERQDTEQA
jgi:hypothetical protein